MTVNSTVLTLNFKLWILKSYYICGSRELEVLQATLSIHTHLLTITCSTRKIVELNKTKRKKRQKPPTTPQQKNKYPPPHEKQEKTPPNVLFPLVLSMHKIILLSLNTYYRDLSEMV